MNGIYHKSALSSFERLNKLGWLEPTLSHLCFLKFPYLLDLSSVLFCFALLLALHMKLFAGVHLTSTRTLFPFLSCHSLFVELGCGFGPHMCMRISAKAEPVLLRPPPNLIHSVTDHSSFLLDFFFSFKEQWRSASTESFLSEKYFSKA